MTDVALGSDAFFPFGDNIERAHRSGVKYIAQPGGSVRDDNVIETCNKYKNGNGIYRNSFIPSLKCGKIRMTGKFQVPGIRIFCIRNDRR